MVFGQQRERGRCAVARIHEIDRPTCRRHVEGHFTVDRMIDAYMQVYEMILQDGPI
jgi:hypothetical protein